MASAGRSHITRRSLFAAAAMTTATCVATGSVIAAQVWGPPNPWRGFLTDHGPSHPGLDEAVSAAKAAGYEPDDVWGMGQTLVEPFRRQLVMTDGRQFNFGRSALHRSSQILLEAH